jgi:hypothetical protein
MPPSAYDGLLGVPMSNKESVVHRRVHSEHVVQLFDSRDSLASSVASFLAPPYAAGESLLLVAKPANWEGIARELRALGCDVDRGIENGRITVLDALTTARTICRHETPDPRLFWSVAEPLVRKLLRRGRLSIYGEMVELFAEEGNFSAALKLEELWCALAEKVAFRLMCGYSSAHFASPVSEAKLTTLCKMHTDVRTGPDDTLGAWLVERARLPFKPDVLGIN